MLTRFTDFDRTFAALDLFRQRMEDAFGIWDGGLESSTVRDVRLNVFDGPSNVWVRAEVPGYSDKDIAVTYDQGVLTISGERKLAAPQGYSVHRQERPSQRFARSFTLPPEIDPERINATVKHGVLTVELAKKPQSQPRQIAVKTT